MAKVKFDELLEAFEFVSFGGMFESAAYVSLDTGAIYWISDGLDEATPPDLGTSDRYLEIPHKNHLDLGSHLALRFAEQHVPDHYETVRGIFHRRGAYARFKDLLDRLERLEDWHRFENAATERALRNWCAENGLEVIDSEKQWRD